MCMEKILGCKEVALGLAKQSMHVLACSLAVHVCRVVPDHVMVMLAGSQNKFRSYAEKRI